ncbi:Dual specificity protein phosphatase PHS1 isoform B [Glycine soja]|uniref:Dual specificity protein phosphatase PHS1 isoform B n=1 Tax=Glycine soja TaxID=3848 RepID=A0A445KAR2_GLYSO|nr:Dual specificity protein phosphatase PHS1 isoform B [Glycine soja]
MTKDKEQLKQDPTAITTSSQNQNQAQEFQGKGEVEKEEEAEAPLTLSVTSKVLNMLGDITAGPASMFAQWLQLVRKRTSNSRTSGFPHRSSSMPSSPGESIEDAKNDQQTEFSLWERLGKAEMLDIESSSFSWDRLSSLHHTEHTSSNEHSEDEINRALEVTVNSGGVVFFAFFNGFGNDDASPKEAAAVIKISSSRMATQSERLGYEFAKQLGVQTPQITIPCPMSTEKYDVLLVRLNGKNYSAWAFQFQIFVTGKDLWGHVDGSSPVPDKDTAKVEHAKWTVKDAQGMAWILGSVDPNIVLNLRPYKTAATMWNYLKKVYVYADLPSEGLSSVQTVHETTKRDQFLMKLRSDFEDLVQLAGLPNASPVDTPMEVNVKYRRDEGELLDDPTHYRKLVGSLIYLTITRLNISFVVHTVSKFMQSPRHLHLLAVKQIIRYLLGTPKHGLFFPADSSVQLQAYSDADWAGCPDTRKSTIGWCMFLGNAPISWKCKKQDLVSKSSTEAEYRAMSVTCSEIIWLRGLLIELGFSQAQPTPLHADNTSAMQIAANPVYYEWTKHIEGINLRGDVNGIKCHSKFYVHSSPLLESTTAFESQELAERTSAALDRIMLLDLVIRNEDRLPCRQLRWRGNSANLLLAEKIISGTDTAGETPDSAMNSYGQRANRALQKEKSFKSQTSLESMLTNFIVAIDSGVPRRPPVGKRTDDQVSYPKLVELLLNSSEFSSNLLHDITGGRLGFPHEDTNTITDVHHTTDVTSVVHVFRSGFRAALRDLQGFHIFLLTLHQKLDNLLRSFMNAIGKISSGESEKEDAVVPGSASPTVFGSCPSPSSKERLSNDIHQDCSDSESQRTAPRASSSSGKRDCCDSASSVSREGWHGKHSKGSADSLRALRLTTKLRDLHKLAKVDSESHKEFEHWNEMLKNDAVKLCLEHNFNTGFFEGCENNTVVDAYELKVRLEHILERIACISEAANTEKPSAVTNSLFIGGALAARSTYTLQRLGITHILCLCTNEIGQSDSQFPDLFMYTNFSVCDTEDSNISSIFEEACDFIDYVEQAGRSILVHCFEGKSRSATLVLAYLMLRKKFTLLEAWSALKRVHRRSQPNDGFAKILLELDLKLHGKVSMEWQQRKPMMKVCPICGKNAGLSSSSLKLHLQKSLKRLSSGSVDSAMTMEIQKALTTLKISRGGSVSPKPRKSHSTIEA